MRWIGYVVAGLLLLAILAAAYIWIASSQKLSARVTPRPAQLAAPTPAQLADAPRQLRVLGCVSCHGDTLQGKIFLDEPGVGRLYASNLTIVAAKASDAQIEQAIRQGIGYDGRPLLVMPSEGYQFLTDAEVAALIAAIRRHGRTGADHPPARVGPLGRVAIVMREFRTAPTMVDEYRRSPLPDFGPKFARGRHIVETNCSECHGADLKGKEVQPGVVSTDLAIAGAYDLEQLQTMLRTGVAPGNKKLGLMGAVARSDFKHLTNAEIADIHAYLVERARQTR